MHRLFLIVLLLAAPACAAQSLLLELRDEVQVGGLFFTVGEIATVRSGDTVLADRVRAQRVGRTPRVGHVLGVTRTDVGARIARAFPSLRHDMQWQGPRLARIEGVGQTFVSDDYLPTARSFLAAWMDERFSRYEIEALPTRTDVSLPFGAIGVVARLPASAAARKRMSVWLDFSVDGQHYRSLPVWFAVEAWAPGFIATEKLAAGATPSRELVTSSTVEVTGSCERLADEAQLDGDYRLKQPVSAGRALCAEDLDLLPAVVRGQELVVTASSGPVVVSTVAFALEDGEPGQIIDVRRDRRGARFAVQVTGLNQAQVIGEHDD